MLDVGDAGYVAEHDPRKPYRAYGAAYKLWTCRDEEILIEGPAGTGKTRAILEKVYFLCLKYPGIRVLLLRQTRESLTESVLVTWEEKVVPAGSPILGPPKRNLRSVYRFPNGSNVVVGGLDKPTKIMSTEYDVIAIFEATETNQEAFENLTTRLRNYVMPYQQIIADCNPSGPYHWLNIRAKQGLMTRLRSRHQDNPKLYEHGKWTDDGRKYLKKLSRLTGARRLRLLKGIWAASEGMVFEDWNPDVHICSRFPIPADWRRFRCIDFGFRAPAVCQWWALDNDGRMYRYRELYQTGITTQILGEKILAMSGKESYLGTVCDHDLEDRMTLENMGIPTVAAYKDIKRGIEAVRERLAIQEDGYPRIFYLRDSRRELDRDLEENGLPTKTEDEFDGYVYPKGIDGKPVKEIPVQVNDHGMDDTRYAVGYADNLSGWMVKLQVEEAMVVKSDSNSYKYN